MPAPRVDFATSARIGRVLLRLRADYSTAEIEFLTLKKLAELSGVGPTRLQRLESFQIEPLPSELEKLSRFFGVPITVWFDGT